VYVKSAIAIGPLGRCCTHFPLGGDLRLHRGSYQHNIPSSPRRKAIQGIYFLIMESTKTNNDNQPTGSCICGAVSIKVKDASTVIRTMSCHCKHCQKGAGGPFQVNALFRQENIVIDDMGKVLKKYLFLGNDVASGFPKEKWFCSVSCKRDGRSSR
jgi:hypothetical protein